jgi:hypothetical protein
MISYNDNNVVMMFGSNLNELWGFYHGGNRAFFFKICDIKNVAKLVKYSLFKIEIPKISQTFCEKSDKKFVSKKITGV